MFQLSTLPWSKHKFPTTLTSSVCARRREFSTSSVAVGCSSRREINRRSSAPQASSTPFSPTALRNSSANVPNQVSRGRRTRETELLTYLTAKCQPTSFLPLQPRARPIRSRVLVRGAGSVHRPLFPSDRRELFAWRESAVRASERTRRWGGAEGYGSPRV